MADRTVWAVDPLDPSKGEIAVTDQGDVVIRKGDRIARGSLGDFVDGSPQIEEIVETKPTPKKKAKSTFPKNDTEIDI